MLTGEIILGATNESLLEAETGRKIRMKTKCWNKDYIEMLG